MKMIWATFALIVVLAATSVWTATSTVSPSQAGQQSSAVGPNEIKPSECSSIALSNTVSGSGAVAGTASSDLIVAGGGADTIEGRDGNDCIVAGGGDDTIDGGAGTDVCLGGPGTDVFLECETQFQ